MDLSNILSISGKGGLFELVGQSKNGVVVESLLDGKRIPAYSNQQISSLEEISIYGDVDDIPLKEIFERIYKMENGGKSTVSPNDSGNELRDYFSDVCPEHDAERVYTSDIKKVLKWYNLLLERGKLNLSEDSINENSKDSAENNEEENVTE